MTIENKLSKYLNEKKYSGVDAGVDLVLRIKTSSFGDDDPEDAGFKEAEEITKEFCKQIRKIRMKGVTVKIAEYSGNADAI